VFEEVTVLPAEGILLLAFPSKPNCQGSPTYPGQRWIIALVALEGGR
jgi:hypothetical protein